MRPSPHETIHIGRTGVAAHAGFGHAHHLLAYPDQARAHWLQAHALYHKLGVPKAAEIRSHLTAIDDLSEIPQLIEDQPRS